MIFNNQAELFTHAVTEIFKQGERCTEDGSCQYRFNNMKCIVGHCIDDEDYRKSMENPNNNCIRQVVAKHQLDYLKPYINLLEELQVVHDEYHPIRWVVEFQKVADKWKIPVSVQDLSEEYTTI